MKSETQYLILVAMVCSVLALAGGYAWGLSQTSQPIQTPHLYQCQWYGQNDGTWNRGVFYSTVNLNGEAGIVNGQVVFLITCQG